MDKACGPIAPEMLAPLRAACGAEPLAGAVVLGSGLGGLLDAWRPEVHFSAAELPGYPRSSVAGHAGRLAVVRWSGRPGLVLQGRVHFYEGYPRPAVTCGVRLAAALGARWLLLTNAAGAIDPRMTPGTVMVVEDHLRILLGARPARRAAAGDCLRGTPYQDQRAEDAFRILSRCGLRVVRGVLSGGLGPTYETAAEVEMSRRMGGHAACMSTVIEAEEAARLGLEVTALSLITNLGTGLAAEPLQHAEVVAMARKVGPELARGIAELVAYWSDGDSRNPDPAGS